MVCRGSNGLLPYDQRGPGFPRAFGAPDVGAYEWSDPGVPTAGTALTDVTAAGGGASAPPPTHTVSSSWW